MNNSPKTSIVLNALAFAGLLVFASQAADAASTQSPSVDSSKAKAPTSANALHKPSVADDTAPNTTNTREVDDADVIGDVGNQDIEDIDNVDVGEIELPELETPDSN